MQCAVCGTAMKPMFLAHSWYCPKECDLKAKGGDNVVTPSDVKSFTFQWGSETWRATYGKIGDTTSRGWIDGSLAYDTADKLLHNMHSYRRYPGATGDSGLPGWRYGSRNFSSKTWCLERIS